MGLQAACPNNDFGAYNKVLGQASTTPPKLLRSWPLTEGMLGQCRTINTQHFPGAAMAGNPGNLRPVNYEKLDKEYTRIFDVRKSTKAYEKITEATGLGLAAVKPEGGSIIYDAPSPGVTVDVHARDLWPRLYHHARGGRG
jgi:hypothetical protein